MLRKSYLLFSHNYLNCVLSFVLGKDLSRMNALTEKWGPVPRILLRILEDPRDEVYFESEVAHAINVAIQNPRSVFVAIADHNSSTTFSASSTVFFIKPESKSHRDLHSAYVPTHWLISQLADRLVREKEDARVEFFHAISVSPFISGSMSGEIVRCSSLAEKFSPFVGMIKK